MKQTFLALALLSIPFILLFIISVTQNVPQPGVVSVYGFSFFGGFIGTIIMGQTFKTLPFIVWMHITNPGKLPEIMPKDLFNERCVKGQMFLYLSGYLLFLSGLLTKQLLFLYSGSCLMTIAAAWYLVHVLFIIKKFSRND
jgi:hypothetical protein